MLFLCQKRFFKQVFCCFYFLVINTAKFVLYFDIQLITFVIFFIFIQKKQISHIIRCRYVIIMSKFKNYRIFDVFF